jgi:glycosyltransferase involved in cell wall biosynthesis
MKALSPQSLPFTNPDKANWPWTQDCSEVHIKKNISLPILSIVIPSFNQDRFLEETIRSVLLQNYPKLELIVIDGGSTDNSLNIIKKYEQMLAYWVSEKDRGQSHAINKGFQKCTGDIITFLGSDDMYLPGVFWDVASQWHRSKHYGAIIGGFVYMDEHSNIEESPRLPRLPHEGPIDLSIGPPGIYRLHQVSTFYTRKALDSVGRNVRENLRYTMDRELLYRICRKFKIRLVDVPYGAFRRYDNSKSFSETLPFYREFSQLPLAFFDSDKRKNHLRKRMSRHYCARGYIKMALQKNGRIGSTGFLLVALVYEPRLILKTGYLSHWIDIIGIRPFVEKFRHSQEKKFG